MTKFRIALAALCAAATIGSAAPAQASGGGGQDCDARLDNLIAQFYDMADRRSYEDAAEWWQARWHAYYQSCVQH
jgi:hypothetical protein